MHTGQIFVFGESNHESALQEQNIFDWVFSWMWVSSPMIDSYSVMKAPWGFTEFHDSVAVAVSYAWAIDNSFASL